MIRTVKIMVVLGLLALCGTAWCVEPIPNLIAHWTFDEGSGTTAYDSFGSNHGTIYGALWTTGPIDGALSFDGDDYVSMPDSASLDITGDEITVATWFKPGAAGNSIRPIVSKWLGSNSAYSLCYKTDSVDLIGFAVKTGGTAVGANPTPVNDISKWYHLAGVYDGSQITVYVDGVAGAPVANTGNINNSSKSLRISGFGEGAQNPHHITGLVDDVRIYDRALSAEEVQQLYQDGLAEVVGLEIVGPNEVAENFSASYKAIAYYDNNSTRDVTDSADWQVEPNMHASIENGLLTTEEIYVPQEDITIYAQYTGGEVTVEAEKEVLVFAVCPSGSALSFDGDDDYVSLGSPANLDDLPLNDLTISAWIYDSHSTENTWGTIFGAEVGGGYGWSFRTFSNESGDRSLHFYVHHTTTIAFYHSNYGTISQNTWHHVVGVWDAGTKTAKLYIDATEPSYQTTTAGNGTYKSDASNDKEIGRIPHIGGTQYFNGTIDDVRIYNRALSAEEIRANMHTRLSGDEPGLVGYWDFDEGEGQIAYDLSPYGNHGRLGSTPDADASDPAWIESDAPIGICTLEELVERNLSDVLDIKLDILEQLGIALAEEEAVVDMLKTFFKNRDFGSAKKKDVGKAKKKIHSAIKHEKKSKKELEKSIEELEDALVTLGQQPLVNALVQE